MSEDVSVAFSMSKAPGDLKSNFVSEQEFHSHMNMLMFSSYSFSIHLISVVPLRSNFCLPVNGLSQANQDIIYCQLIHSHIWLKTVGQILYIDNTSDSCHCSWQTNSVFLIWIELWRHLVSLYWKYKSWLSPKFFLSESLFFVEAALKRTIFTINCYLLNMILSQNKEP